MTSTGEVLVWGSAGFGQLGLGESALRERALPIDSLRSKTIVAVACGWAHTVVVTADQEVHTWGQGEFGQLGHGDTANHWTPSLVRYLRGRGLDAVACGRNYTAAWSTEGGDLYTWGQGDHSKLGHDSTADQWHPRLVAALRGRRVVHVSLGGEHAACVTAEGDVLTWGWGKGGRLGHGDTQDAPVPRCLNSLSSTRIMRVACGDSHCLALTDVGDVMSWGRNTFGQLGHGNNHDRLVPHTVEALRGRFVFQIECGGLHSTAIVGATGEVMTWGRGKDGQLGHGDARDYWAPSPVRALEGQRITTVACGFWATACLSDTGELFTFGFAGDGVLGRSGDGKMPQKVEGDASHVSLRLVACGSAHIVAWGIPTDPAWIPRRSGRGKPWKEDGPPPRVMCVCDPLVKQGHHYVQWVASGLYDCVYTPREEASVVIGLSSIGFWMMAQVPQLYKNWRNHTAASLSAVFLLLWLGGDATNLIGCLLTQQLPTQIYTAMYFVFMDMLLFYQFLYYTSKNNRHVGGLLGLLKQTLRRTQCVLLKRKARSTHEQLGDEDSQVLESAPLGDTPPVTRYDSQPFDEDAPDRSPSHVVFAVLVFVVLWPVWSRSLSFGFLGEENEAVYTGRSLLEEDICGDSYKSIAPWQEVLGQVVGWISAVIYVSSRVPQIIKNKRRKSVEGLSGYMFMAAVMGNVAYSLSIFLRSTSSHFLAPKVPWIIGSVGTLQFDFTVLAQFLYYRTRAKRVVLKEDLDDAHSSGTLVQQHV